MANQYFPMLPKLKENSAVTPDKTSVWEDKEYDFLNALIKSIAVSGSIKDIGTIDSIPDVWARPLLFEMALFDKEGTEQQFVKGFHERIVGEWRSILAMFALNDIKHLNLRVEEVRIGQGNGNIERILNILKPQERNISDDTNWDILYIIFYKDIPIGLTSPMTLVASAADYVSMFNGNLPKPWSSDGLYLMDPIPYLTKEEICALYSWLNKLADNINAHVKDNRDNERFLNILDCIRKFTDDAKKACQSYQISNMNNFQYKNNMLKIHAGIFKYLDSAVKAKEATAKDSAVRLIVSDSRKPEQDILLVSTKMLHDFANEYNLPTTQIIVWPGITANDIDDIDVYDNGTSIGNINLNNAKYYNPEMFFTEYMAVMDPGGDALKGTIKIRGEELLASEDLGAILPIRKELLEFFTPEDIADRLSIEDDGNNYLIHFAFPLSGVYGEGHDFDFVKAYPKKDLIYLQTNIPAIEIWPNICRENWNRYYLYYENSEALNNKKDLGKDFFYVMPWKYNKNIIEGITENSISNQYTLRMNGYPEVLLCSVNASVRGNVRTQMIETGLLLLDKPKMVEADDLSNWRIGIDFGTSSTMIYYRDNNQLPKPLNFNSHLFQVTNSGQLRNNTFLRFIPSINVQSDGSFLSIFHLLNTKKTHDTIKPLQDGHILTLPGDMLSKLLQYEVNRIDSNLKWQADDTGRYKATAYLEQICMQSTVEAAIAGVANLRWSFSYPAAFSDEERESFRKICIKAIECACEDTDFKPNVDELDTELESVATALYFNKLNNSDTNFSDGAICLDIGAGTTDISIISGQPGHIVYHTSILFAGRYLFKYILQNPYYKEKIKKKYGQAERNAAISDTMMFDNDMRVNSEQYLVELANITGKEDIKKMLEQSQFALAGILYYVGKILRYLSDNNIYVEGHVPDIYIGGNGARILYWITGGGSYDKSSIRLKVLKNIILSASGLQSDVDFNIYLSDKPKIEVAMGMLEDKPVQSMFNEEKMYQKIFGETEDEYVLNSVLSGADFKINDMVKSDRDFVSAKDISAGIVIDDINELDNFVEIFNENRKSIWLNGIKIDDVQRNEIKKRINSYYVSEKGKKVKEIHVEPIFIIGLKKLMEMLTSEHK